MKILVLSLWIVFILFSRGLSQDCSYYLPSREGLKIRMSHFDEQDRMSSTSSYKVKKTEQLTESDYKVFVEVGMKIPERDYETSAEMVYSCEDGNYIQDLGQYIAMMTRNMMKDMELQVRADRLSLPSDPKPGQDLGEGSAEISILKNGKVMATLHIEMYDRIYQGLERVRTDFGIFTCRKFTAAMTMRFGILRFHNRSAEWYAPDLGLIRSESYDKKGKLQSYTLMTGMTEP